MDKQRDPTSAQEELVTFCGAVMSYPVFCGTHTSFDIQTGERSYVIVRLDPKWQKRDVMFLCCGQTVEITGRMILQEENTVEAERIIVTGYPPGRYQENDDKPDG